LKTALQQHKSGFAFFTVRDQGERSSFKKLEKLTIGPITSVDLEVLTTLVNLQELDIKSSHLVDKKIVSTLKKFEKLKRLRTSLDDEINEADQNSLRKILPDLQIL